MDLEKTWGGVLIMDILDTKCKISTFKQSYYSLYNLAEIEAYMETGDTQFPDTEF